MIKSDEKRIPPALTNRATFVRNVWIGYHEPFSKLHLFELTSKLYLRFHAIIEEQSWPKMEDRIRRDLKRLSDENLQK